MADSFNIVATERVSKKRIIIESNLSRDEALRKCSAMSPAMKKAFKYFKAAKAK